MVGWCLVDLNEDRPQWFDLDHLRGRFHVALMVIEHREINPFSISKS
jgi:hypothetical protein